MSGSASICPTCISNLEEGSRLTEPLTTFLCNVLHFKPEILAESQQAICRKCFKTLIDLKCFYTQLRDVEVYFENKSGVIINSNDHKVEEEDMEDLPYIGDLECTVSIADESTLDPIEINEDEECCVVEEDDPAAAAAAAAKKPKLTDTPTGKRIVCLTCSKLFQSVSDLRTHEKTAHSTPISITKASPVFLPVPKILKCPECSIEFHQPVSLEVHMIQHQNARIANLKCDVCKRVFLSKDLKTSHNKKVCKNCRPVLKRGSQTSAENHGKAKPNGNTVETQVAVKKVENSKDEPGQKTD